jgi:hypothetical protein
VGKFKLAAACGAMAGLLLTLAPARAADGDFVLGSGNGIATTVKIGPQTGGLTIAVTFGQALADFQERLGRASSRAIDFGIIETALVAPGCFGAPSSFKQSDFPQPLDADSRDAASNTGKVEQEGGSEPGSPLFGTIGRKEVKALPTPWSRAVTDTAAFGITGLIQVGAGHAEVVSRIVDDIAREVVGTVDVASLDLFGGMVRMSGLHWEALHRTGKDPASTGTFSLSTLSLGGVPIPVPSGATELAQLLAPINAILLGTGLSIDPPVLNTANSASALSPLRVRLDHSPLGQAVVAPAVTAAQPLRQALIDVYNEQMACEAPIGSQEIGKVGRAVVLPTDIALSAFTGTGGFVIELGGVRATTEGQVFEDPFADRGGDSPSPDLGGAVETPPTDVLGATFDAGPDVSAVGVPAAGAPSSGDEQVALARDLGSLPGHKGGAGLAIGLIGLVVVVCIAAADYFHMRRGKRVIPEID